MKNLRHINEWLNANKLSLKVTSATKWLLLKMCHLRHRLRIFLFHRKVMFRSQDIQAFVSLTISWFTKSVMSWWVLLHETGCIFEYIFWTTTHYITKHIQLIDISKGNNFQESLEQFWGLELSPRPFQLSNLLQFLYNQLCQDYSVSPFWKGE